MTGFTAELARIEARLDLPYPERALFVEELGADLEAAYQDLRDRGLPEAEARLGALRALALSPQDSADLSAVHRPAVRRALDRLPAPVRDLVEATGAMVAFAAVILDLALEAPVILFLREGGVAMYVVLAIGGFALLLQIQRAFTWFLLRNHSSQALRQATSTPLYLAAATLCAGLMGTAMGYYVVLMVWAQGKIGPEELKVGLREPLSCLIVGAALATLVVLLQGASQAGLRGLRVTAAS